LNLNDDFRKHRKNRSTWFRDRSIIKAIEFTVNDAIARYIAFALPNFILVVGSQPDYKVNAIALKRILRINKNIGFMPINTQQSSGH
jgi:hypothetical protein